MNNTEEGKAGFAARLVWNRRAIDACADRASGLAGLPVQVAPDEAGLAVAAEGTVL